MQKWGFAIIGLVLLVLALPLGAQQDRATFTGIVTDPSGLVIPNVNITIQNTDTNAVYRVTTNAVGQYTVPNLPIGRYKISFGASGFRTAVREGLELSVSQVARVDIQLQVGAAAETIEVRAEVPALQTENPEVGQLLSNRGVIDLPLSFDGARAAENFTYKLAPGVTGTNTWDSHVNGSPATSKDVLLDGQSATIYAQGVFGISGPSLEGLQEFKVQTSGLNAEYGQTGGGLFNFVMKSGSNQLHGSALAQFRNEWMDSNSFSRNYYCATDPNFCGAPRDRKNNWAGSFGGPVYIPKIYNGKDKSFFYVAYEKYDETNRGAQLPTSTVPTPDWWNGNFSNYLTGEVVGQDALGRDVYRGAIYDPATTRLVNGVVVRDMFPGNTIPASRISKVAQNVGNIMQKDYAPQIKNADGSYALINNFFKPDYGQLYQRNFQFSIKGDHSISSNHKLSGSFVYTGNPNEKIYPPSLWNPNLPDGGPLSGAFRQPDYNHYGRIAYDFVIRPTVLNHWSISANRQTHSIEQVHYDEPGGQILGISGINQEHNFPELQWSGGDRVSLTQTNYAKRDRVTGTSYGMQDTVSWVRGRHSMKFGGETRRYYLNYADVSGPGRFSFSSDQTGLPGDVASKVGHPFASFLLGDANGGDVLVGTPTGSELRSWSAFAQDDFKLSSNVTVNLGLRWDYAPVQVEKYDRMFTFSPTAIDPNSGLPGALIFAGEGAGRTGKRGFVENHWKNFAPRIGFAYHFAPKAVFRAAYGMYFSGRAPNDWTGDPWGSVTWAGIGWGQYNNVNSPGNLAPAFNLDSGYPGVAKQSQLNPSLEDYNWGGVYWDPDGGRLPYTQQWNAHIEYELPAKMVLDLGYIGTKATALFSTPLRRINQMPTSVLKLGDKLSQWIDSEDAIPADIKAMGVHYPYKQPGSWISIAQLFEPFPQVQDWNGINAYNSPLGFSTYHSLQISLNKNLSHGLSWIANYTFSKTIDNVDDQFGTWVNHGALDAYNLKLEKSISSFDQSHIVKIGLNYELPVGRGRQLFPAMHPLLDAVVGGWKVTYIGNYFTGVPLGLGATPAPYFNNGGVNRALIVNPNRESLRVPFDPSKFDMSQIGSGGVANNMYLNTSIIKDPAPYTFGNASYRMATLRDFPTYNEDLGLQKNFSIKERMRVQFRAEFLNAFNRHRFGNIDTYPTSMTFGQVTSVSGNRQGQVGMRLDF